jgi:plastin-1
VYDKLQPGIVNWNSTKKKVRNKWEKLGNCNYAIKLGLKLNFKIVSIAGEDIVNKNRKLILGKYT